ncbi:chromophore lyase CpcT/CpeT [Flavobacterium sp.]|uniref:chromophore lyase CpcT/CpeT n=1 Tax=Flavobacterium sp. TaxID=239 RepID=UPI00333E3CA7
MKELVAIMQGHYSSEKQASLDKDYFNISLRMTPIWKSKGHYLFVEQALFNKQDQPYRVRIYKLTQQGEQFISTIYTLKDEKKWIGKWETPEAYDQLTEADIELKDGCEVVLKRTRKNTFEGATGDKTCPSELRGARWANSKVTVTQNTIISWDQGFDKDGKQVWGATKGGYEFIKL